MKLTKISRPLLVIAIYFLSFQCFASEPYVVGAIGDSISAGFNAVRYGDNRELSWSGALGANTQVRSHAVRLQELMPDRIIEVRNEAFVRADSLQLARQTTRLLRYKPDYVTVAIGANDVCVWDKDYLTQLKLFEKMLTESLTRIVKKNPAVKIVLAPVPSLPLLYEISSKNKSCQNKWDTMDICRPLLDKDLKEEDRQQFKLRYLHLNQVIEDVSLKFPDQVRFAKAIATTRFDSSSISSLDCFHPSVKGHNELSENSFDPTWY